LNLIFAGRTGLLPYPRESQSRGHANVTSE